MGYKVSILVPVFNVEPYIEKCARSLFEQDYDNIEFIFVDDCTPDNSIEVLKKTLDDYPLRKKQVRFIKHERNRGVGAARNTAVQHATGLFLIHCDSDDWMDTKAVSLLVEQQIATGADVVSGKSCMVYEKKEEEVKSPTYCNKKELLLNMLSINNPASFAIWKRLIRASLYHDHHIEVQEGVNMGEDLQVTPKLVYFADSVSEIDHVVCYYNRTNQSSYCQHFRTNELFLQQYMASSEIIRGFFEDKEREYYVAASEKALYNYWLCGHYAAKYRHKVVFEECRTAINGKYAEYQYCLGDRNSFKNWFQQRYWMYGSFLRVRSFVYRKVKKAFGKD